MLMVPLRTDAADGKRVLGTASLIAANTLIALLFGFGPDWGVLHYGELEPLAWVTSGFIHYGVLHLVFNMVFLWVFGLTVESLLGTRRFLAAYVAILVVEGLVTQLLTMRFDVGECAGASGAISGLLAIAVQWSPRNTFDTLVGFFLYWRVVALRVTTFAGIWLFFQLLPILLTGFAMSSELLHMIGFGAGAAIGYLALARGWVDCGGWDLYSIRKHGSPRYRVPVHTLDPQVDALASMRAARARADERVHELVRGLAKARQWSDAHAVLVDIAAESLPPDLAALKAKLAAHFDKTVPGQ